jgi:hypothetical protein
VVLGDLHEQEAFRAGVGSAGDPAGLALEDGAAEPAGQPDRLRDTRDRADLGELALVARDEKDALLTVGVHGKRHVHRGEDDGVVERNQ